MEMEIEMELEQRLEFSHSTGRPEETNEMHRLASFVREKGESGTTAELNEFCLSERI